MDGHPLYTPVLLTIAVDLLITLGLVFVVWTICHAAQRWRIMLNRRLIDMRKLTAMSRTACEQEEARAAQAAMEANDVRKRAAIRDVELARELKFATERGHERLQALEQQVKLLQQHIAEEQQRSREFEVRYVDASSKLDAEEAQTRELHRDLTEAHADAQRLDEENRTLRERLARHTTAVVTTAP